MKTNTDIGNTLKQMHSFTQDLTSVTYLLLSETMRLLQVQPGRGGRREAIEIREESPGPDCSSGTVKPG